jgi:hypothetical protein
VKTSSGELISYSGPARYGFTSVSATPGKGKSEASSQQTTTTTKEVPVGYFGQITPPSTLEQSYKSDVFSVSYPGVSPALNLFTLGLTGWGETPAGKTFLPQGIETTTTTTTYTSVDLSSTQLGLMNIALAINESIGLNLIKSEAFTHEQPTPDNKIFDFSSLQSSKAIGTKQDSFLLLNPPDLSKIYPSGMIRGVIPDVFAEKRMQQLQLEYLRSPYGILELGAAGVIAGVYSSTIGIPIGLYNLFKEGTQGAFFAKESLISGISQFVTRTAAFSWTPGEAAYFGGSVIGGIGVSEFIYKPTIEKLLPYFTKTSVTGMEKGYMTGTKEVPGVGLQYNIDLYGASQARTTINYMGAEFTFSKAEALSQTKFAGVILYEPIGEVEVIGFTAGRVFAGGKLQPVIGIGVLGKEQAIPAMIMETSPGHWRLSTSMPSVTPGVSFSQIGKEGEIWRSNFILNKIYEGPTFEGPGTFYFSYSKIISESGVKASGVSAISIIDKTRPNTFQAFSGIDYELSTQMAKFASESLESTKAAAIQSSLSSAAGQVSTPSQLGLLAYNLLGIVPLHKQGGLSSVMKANIQVTEPVVVKSATTNIQIEKVIPKVSTKTAAITITKQFSPQAYISQQVSKTSGIAKTIDITRAQNVSRVMDMTRTADITKTLNISRTVDITKTIDLSRTMDISRIVELTRTVETEKTPPMIPSIPPPPQLPPVLPIGTGIDLDFMKQLRKLKSVETKKITKYTPSMVAVGFDIKKVINTKRLFTGIEIRPISIPKRGRDRWQT